MNSDDDPAVSITPDALQALGELLNLAARHGFGITVTPDAEGWSIGYMRGMGGGDLAADYDLLTAVRAARRPLLDLAETVERNRRG